MAKDGSLARARKGTGTFTTSHSRSLLQTMRTLRTRALASLVGLASLTAVPSTAAPRLRSADAAITFTSPTSCEVTLTLSVVDASEVEHRLEIVPGSRVDLVGVERATAVGPAADIGRTRALTLRPGAADYTLRYHVDLAADRPHRCPLWLPAAPADGRSRNVRLTVAVPDGASPAGTMPTLAWNGSRGTAAVGHLPSFVLVPFTPPGAPRPWDVARVMDAVALATLAFASLAWWWRERRRRERADLRTRAEAHG